MAEPFKSKYFFYYNFINALIPRVPMPETAISALKAVNVLGLIGIILRSEDGRHFAGYAFPQSPLFQTSMLISACLSRVCDEVRLLLHLPVDDGEDEEVMGRLGVPDIPNVPPNSPANLTPSASNAPSGTNTPRPVALPQPVE